MTDAYKILGVPPAATAEEIQTAYHRLVKAWHPDRFSEKEEQEKAQEEMIRINLAYEEALRHARGPMEAAAAQMVPLERALQMASASVRRGNYDIALYQLHRTQERSASWHALEGEIHMAMQRYAEAHSSFRRAVLLNPEEQQYHQAAYRAAVLARKKQNPLQRLASALRRKK